MRPILAALAVAFVVTFTALASSQDEPSSRPAPRQVGLGAPSRPAASTGAEIARLSEAVKAEPGVPAGYVALAAAYLQGARETADPAYYARASDAIERAAVRRPDDPAVLTVRGTLRLSLHDFRGALEDARRARVAAPDANGPFPVLVDALVELGRYEEAEAALQTLVDRRPGLESYARVAYLRELRGDLEGAAQALRLAVSAAGGAGENGAYVAALLGDLELVRGRRGPARSAYADALARLPGFGAAEAGMARLAAMRGDRAGAIRRLRPLVGRLPLPQFVVELGETELAAGRRSEARRDLALLDVQQRLLRASGVRPDMQTAVHEADHGDPRRAVSLGRAVWAAAPSVGAADALGWALTRSGEPEAGLRWARRALRLGSRDPSFLYHAGIAAQRSGRSADARRWLGRALRQAPRFSVYHAPRAARAMRALERTR